MVLEVPESGDYVETDWCGLQGVSQLSVGDGFMITMAAAPTDTTTATSVVVMRRRGKSRVPNFKYEDQWR